MNTHVKKSTMQPGVGSRTELPQACKDALEAAIAAADLRVLLMVLFQLTGDEKWLSFSPKRDVKLIADEDAGLSPGEQIEIRRAACSLLAEDVARAPVIADPGNELMRRMMSICLGESVPPEYAPLMREELGFVARDVKWRSSPIAVPGVYVLIVGAGVSGIALGARLERLGVPYMIVERHDDVGGVWLENRYPGAGVDTPNHSYSYSFGSAYPWTRYFSPRDEIYDYLRRCADEFRIRPKIRFNCEVVGARWDVADKIWRVTLREREGLTEFAVPILVSAIGQFGLPAKPTFRGIERFSGPVFHSAEWPRGLDLTGKRLALIGTGASAMQIVPTVINQVARVAVYQRTPQWVRPIARYDETIGPAKWLLDRVPLYAAWFRFTIWWRYGDGLLPALRKDPTWPHPERSLNRRNERFRLEMLEHIKAQLGQRSELIEKCTPSYPPFGKRILLDNGWYKAIGRPNAELVTEKIAEIAPDGVRTEDGVLRPADVIVYATGFKVAAMAARLNIRGRDGRDLASVWAGDDPRAYLGVTVPAFPNLFMMQGPNTGLGHGGSAIFQAESQARYISGMLVRMIEDGIAAVEPRPEALDRFIDMVDSAHEQLIWTHPGVSTYYRNQRGRVISVMPFRLVDYWAMTREPDLANYILEPSAGALK